MSYMCQTCGKGFKAGYDAGLDARNRHCRAKGHVAPAYECDSCPEHFKSEAARRAHMTAERHHFDDAKPVEKDHEPEPKLIDFGSPDDGADDGSNYSYHSEMEWECALCHRWFYTVEDCRSHEIADHFHCSECKHTFSAEVDIKKHLESHVHSNHVAHCPLCPLTENNIGTIVDHVENGKCPNARTMNREKLHKLVRSKDPNNRISRESLYGYRTTAPDAKYVADQKAWNGKGYQCYTCRHEFNTLAKLNNHLGSERHEERLYHCPNAGCKGKFKTLTAAILHLSSERHKADPVRLERFLAIVLEDEGVVDCWDSSKE